MNETMRCQWRPQVERRQNPIVYIVEPHSSTRDAMVGLVERSGWRAATASTAEEHLVRPRAIAAGCLVVEQHLPGMSGLELQKLVADRKETPVILTSRSADVQTTVKAMKSGAFDFLMKPVGDGPLLISIALAIERSCLEVRRAAHVRELELRYDELTRRERDVMRLVITGRMNKQVGFDLGISEITVKVHRGNVMRKMRAKCLIELVDMAANLRATGRDADQLDDQAPRDRRTAHHAQGMRRAEPPSHGHDAHISSGTRPLERHWMERANQGDGALDMRVCRDRC